jgi:hypothetical protein
MSALRQALTDYLAMRRALGYKLDKTERLLGQFVSFVEDRDEKCLTTKRRWPGQLFPQAPTQAGLPGDLPKSVSSPDTSMGSTLPPRCRPWVSCRVERGEQHRTSTRHTKSRA